MRDKLSPQHAAVPLFLQCLLSGLVDSITFTTSQTWVAFMTGNLTQLALALVQFILPPAHRGDHRSESVSVSLLQGGADAKPTNRLLLSSLALLGFSLGAFLCSRFVLIPQKGDHTSGSTPTRGKYVSLALLHTLPFLIYPALQKADGADAIQDDLISSSWLLLLLALPLGSQSHAALSLGKHPFSTTVVFTSSLSSFCSDLSILPYSATRQTAQRAASILALVLGAALGGTLMRLEDYAATTSLLTSGGPSYKTAWAWYSVVALQLAIALAWYLTPAETQGDGDEGGATSAGEENSFATERYRDELGSQQQQQQRDLLA